MSNIDNNEELELGAYNEHNGIDLYCCNCGASFEETSNGFYSPIQYASDYENRECPQCLKDLGYEF